jgi:hypothetical protein
MQIGGCHYFRQVVVFRLSRLTESSCCQAARRTWEELVKILHIACSADTGSAELERAGRVHYHACERSTIGLNTTQRRQQG